MVENMVAICLNFTEVTKYGGYTSQSINQALARSVTIHSSQQLLVLPAGDCKGVRTRRLTVSDA